MALKIGRNEPCPCGSGKKYKACHLDKPEELDTADSSWLNSSENEESATGNLAAITEKEFRSKNIPTDAPGFYNHLNFMAQERRDPKYLEQYARFVRDRQYSDDYLEKARMDIPRICSLLHEELVQDGSHGSCINMSMALSKILEAEGYWNFCVKGALTINYPIESRIRPSFYWPIDHGHFNAGHAWVVAPPFTVIDLTVKQQPYSKNEASYLPEYVITEGTERATVSLDDIYSDSAQWQLNLNRRSELKTVNAPLHRFITEFAPRTYIHDRTNLKYTTVAISMPDGTLKDMSFKLNGMTMTSIYSNIIKPALQ